MGFLIVLVVLFALLWLLLIRPQRRRQLRQAELLNELAVGEEIITAGGLHATIRRLDDEVLTVEISPGVEVVMDRRAVAAKVRPEEPDDELEDAEEPPELTDSSQTAEARPR